MLPGFNHNIRYQGELFHVQTEDGGVAHPRVVTLLYRGGTIVASSRMSYADIVRTDQMARVVQAVMQEQHKQMMRRLKSGEFDSRLFPQERGDSPSPPATRSLDEEILDYLIAGEEK